MLQLINAADAAGSAPDDTNNVPSNDRNALGTDSPTADEVQMNYVTCRDWQRAKVVISQWGSSGTHTCGVRVYYYQNGIGWTEGELLSPESNTETSDNPAARKEFEQDVRGSQAIAFVVEDLGSGTGTKVSVWAESAGKWKGRDVASKFDVPDADGSANTTVSEVVGNKLDAAEDVAGTTASLTAYIKGILSKVSADVAALGNIYFVNAEHASAADDTDHGGRPNYPFATLDYAIGQCTANNHDVIICAPDAEETITSTITVDKAGLTILSPSASPYRGYQIKTTTDVTTLMTVSATDVTITGLRFADASSGFAANSAFIQVAANSDRAHVSDCEFDVRDCTAGIVGTVAVSLIAPVTDIMVERILAKQCVAVSTTSTGDVVDNLVIRDSEAQTGEFVNWAIQCSNADSLTNAVIVNNVFVETDADGSTATNAWDGDGDSVASAGPINISGGAGAILIARNMAVSARDIRFRDLCLDANADSERIRWIDNKSTFYEPYEVRTETGTADIDISEADYTAAPVALLTIEPTAGAPLQALRIMLDLDKDTTGFIDTHTTETLQVIIQKKVDGTNWRNVQIGTAAAANDRDGGNEADAEEYLVGDLTAGEAVRVAVLLSAEVADVEIPYRLNYRGAAPTVTAVAAG